MLFKLDPTVHILLCVTQFCFYVLEKCQCDISFVYVQHIYDSYAQEQDSVFKFDDAPTSLDTDYVDRILHMWGWLSAH